MPEVCWWIGRLGVKLRLLRLINQCCGSDCVIIWSTDPDPQILNWSLSDPPIVSGGSEFGNTEQKLSHKNNYFCSTTVVLLFFQEVLTHFLKVIYIHKMGEDFLDVLYKQML